MKNTIIILGLIGTATAAFGQTTPKQEKKIQQITQNGNNNVVQMSMQAAEGDTITPQTLTQTIIQDGDNLIHIESNATPDSLNKILENVAVDQKGKGNVVSVQGKSGKNNSVQVTQSGSGNSVSIKQN